MPKSFNNYFYSSDFQILDQFLHSQKTVDCYLAKIKKRLYKNVYTHTHIHRGKLLLQMYNMSRAMGNDAFGSYKDNICLDQLCIRTV